MNADQNLGWGGTPGPVDPAHDQKIMDIPIGVIASVDGACAVCYFDRESLPRFADAQDLTLRYAGEVGSMIKVAVGSAWLVATIRTLRFDPIQAGLTIAEVEFLGEGEEERLTRRIHRFYRGITRYPSPGKNVFAVSSEDMRRIYGTDRPGHIEIGMVYPTNDVRASVDVDAMLGKHFALLGSTGTGKSTSAALILHRICECAPQGHIMMIDPHGEYSAAFSSAGAIFDVSNLQLPYWLMNFEEHCEIMLTCTEEERATDADILAKCLLAARSRNRMADGLARVTADAPIPYLLSDLLAALTSEMGKIDKPTGPAPYMRVKAKVEELRSDPRYAFMFSGMLVSDTMAEFIGRAFRLPTHGKPISIIDVSGVPSEVTSVVVATLARLVFDYAIWSRGEVARPVVLVCEEAHRYVPAERDVQGSAVGKILMRIAKEGRKYGVSLGVITQRPSDLAEGILSQCGTILTMRLNNERDQSFVRSAMPEGGRALLDSISALRNRECLIAGEGVAIPMRVRFDTLEAQQRPASADVSFTELWRNSGDEEGRLERIVGRWRNQSR